jgi:predicted CxxxxCH...CXXCH cytochrome family protein
MTTFRLSTLALAVTLAAAGCGKSRPAGSAEGGPVVMTGGAADGSDVTVDSRWCTKCHGDAGRAPLANDAAGVQFAPPRDLAGATTGAKVGAHLAHVQAGTVRGGAPCSTCHVVPANSAAHVPGVTLRGLAASRGATPSFGAGSCTATYCHGNFTGGNGSASLSWTGAPLSGCTACHALPPANSAHTGLSPSDFPTACVSCHGGTLDGTGAIKIAGGLHINGQVDGGCTGCHGTPGRPNGGIATATYDSNQDAAPPAQTTLHAGSTVLVGAHLAHVNPTPSVAGGAQPTGGVYRPIACTECHPDNLAQPHPDNARATVDFSLATGATIGGYVPSLTAAGNGTSVPVSCDTYCHAGVGGGSATTPAWTGAAATCGSCHGFPPASHAASIDTAPECNACHDGTVNADGTINVAGGLHINGQVEGGESTGGQACGDCHAAIFAAIQDAGKASRHALTLDDPAAQTGITWGSPLSSNAAAVRSCTNMCHGDHPHDAGGAGDHGYNAYADANDRLSSPTTSTRAKTDFDGAATNGGLCISCHRNPISGGGATIDKAAYGASAHDFTAASGFTWQFQLHLGAFDRNCTKCHASNVEGRTPGVSVTSSGASSVHFSDNASLLAGSLTLSAGVTDLVCYNCHGSTPTPGAGVQGNRSGKNIQSQFAKASAHLGSGLTCLSCHAPHVAKAGTHATPGNLAGPPIEGAAGAAFTAAPLGLWATPVAGHFTAKTIVAGTDVEATLCFKCHSAFAASLPAGTTDQAKEFNPGNTASYSAGTATFTNGSATVTGTGTSWTANMVGWYVKRGSDTGTATWYLVTAVGSSTSLTISRNYTGTTGSGAYTVQAAGGYHPVLAAADGNMGATGSIKAPFTRTSLMTCTDCHESDTTTDPNGPHGSAAGFLLKGPNTLWSQALVVNAGGATGMPDGTFCINCHNQDFSGGRFTSHTNGDHDIACFNCHAAIPHGGPRIGILNAGAGASADVGGQVAGWDGVAPYWQGTGTARLYLKSFPATNTSSWSSRNYCGCNGTGH